jgi:hypothetical protein
MYNQYKYLERNQGSTFAEHDRSKSFQCRLRYRDQSLMIKGIKPLREIKSMRWGPCAMYQIVRTLHADADGRLSICTISAYNRRNMINARAAGSLPGSSSRVGKKVEKPSTSTCLHHDNTANSIGEGPQISLPNRRCRPQISELRRMAGMICIHNSEGKVWPGSS